MSVKLDAETLYARLIQLRDAWKASSGDWAGADSIVICAGGQQEDEYAKVASVSLWFLGYEFTDTLFAVFADEVYVLCSSTKTKLLAQVAKCPSNLAAKAPKLHIMQRQKSDKDAVNYATLIELLTKAGSRVGTLAQERERGSFFAGWMAALKAASDLQVVDIAEPLLKLIAVKDTKGLSHTEMAAKISTAMMRRFLVPRVEGIIDKEKTVRHADLQGQLNAMFDEPTKINPKLEPSAVDVCYAPSIQSGGNFNLDVTAAGSNADELHSGVIILALGARYKSFCSNVARTLIINASPDQEANYKLLLHMRKHALAAMRDGARLSAVRQAAVAYLESKQPSLVPHFRGCGHAMGVRFRESPLLLDGTESDCVLQAGHAYNLSLGFADLERKDITSGPGRSYALLVADTVVIPKGSSEDARVLTASARLAFTEVSYALDDGDSESDAASSDDAARAGDRRRRPTIDLAADEDALGGRRRTRARVAEATSAAAEQRRLEHQAALAEKVTREGLRRHKKGGRVQPEQRERVKDLLDVESYPSPGDMAVADASALQILVDNSAETVILPVYGYMVPFHISMVKNVSKSDDLLRINFQVPGSTATTHNEANEVSDRMPKMIFVKEATFQIADARHIANVERQIKDLKKRVTLREKVEREQRTLVQQDAVIVKQGNHPYLVGLSVKPRLGGKKVVGKLTAYRNGLRYRSNKGDTVDITYDNIQHAFFQPAESSACVIIHFRLVNEILIKKKKTKDVQFFQDVLVASQDTGRSRAGYRDRDELHEEEMERRRRERLNKSFHKFAKAASDVINRHLDRDFEFDVPYQELGFYGVPFKTTVYLQPTVSCLVNLTDGPPYFVLSVEEIEIVSLERVSFSLKSFDIVFVLKDSILRLDRPPVVVTAVPIKSLEAIKEWADSNELKYYERSTNWLWPQYLAWIREDVLGFYDGSRDEYGRRGWDSFQEEPAEEIEEDSDDSDAFKPESSAGYSEDNFESESEDEYDEDDEDEEDWSAEEPSAESWETQEANLAREERTKRRR